MWTTAILRWSNKNCRVANRNVFMCIIEAMNTQGGVSMFGTAKQQLKAVTPSPIRKSARFVQSAIRSMLLAPGIVASLIAQSQNQWKRYPSIKSAELLATCHVPSLVGKTKTLDLGCGANIRNPFGATESFGVDIRGDLSRCIKQADLSVEAIPFDSESFDFCTAFDFLEHIPRNFSVNGQGRLPFIELMNEIHRILKPGGLFLHSTPAFPSKEVFQDPTHVNIITEDTLPRYFCEPCSWAKTLGYGFRGSFELVEQRWVSSIFVVGILKALK